MLINETIVLIGSDDNLKVSGSKALHEFFISIWTLSIFYILCNYNINDIFMYLH